MFKYTQISQILKQAHDSAKTTFEGVDEPETLAIETTDIDGLTFQWDWMEGQFLKGAFEEDDKDEVREIYFAAFWLEIDRLQNAGNRPEYN